MTKQQQEAEIARLNAVIAGSPAATAATAKAPTVAKAPRTRTATVETVIADAAKGQTFEPFKVLATSNGVSGRYHRGVRANREDLAAIVGWLRTAAGQSYIKTGVL